MSLSGGYSFFLASLPCRPERNCPQSAAAALPLSTDSGNVHGARERPGGEDPFPGSMQGTGAADLAESVRVGLDSECLGELFDPSWGRQSDRQHDHVEILFLDASIEGVAYGRVPAFRNAMAHRDVAPDEPGAGQRPCPLVELLELLSVGANVVVKDRGFDLGVALLGQDHLLDGVHAADGRAVAVAAGSDLPGAHALDPRDLLRRPSIGRTQHRARGKVHRHSGSARTRGR